MVALYMGYKLDAPATSTASGKPETQEEAAARLLGALGFPT
jgi:hypothetical protein